MSDLNELLILPVVGSLSGMNKCFLGVSPGSFIQHNIKSFGFSLNWIVQPFLCQYYSRFQSHKNVNEIKKKLSIPLLTNVSEHNKLHCSQIPDFFNFKYYCYVYMYACICKCNLGNLFSIAPMNVCFGLTTWDWIICQVVPSWRLVLPLPQALVAWRSSFRNGVYWDFLYSC